MTKNIHIIKWVNILPIHFVGIFLGRIIIGLFFGTPRFWCPLWLITYPLPNPVKFFGGEIFFGQWLLHHRTTSPKNPFIHACYNFAGVRLAQVRVAFHHC